MKKPPMGILVLITCIFAAFAFGFFAGRSLNRAPVRITQMQPPATETETLTDPVPTAPPIVNINTATAAELDTLPGIGPVLAGRIIDYREEHGAFRAPEELSKVKGIGEATLADILDMITVGG